MAAYLVVTLTVHDLAWVADYQASVPAIVRRHGGEYLAISDGVRRLEGDGPVPESIVLFTFPSTDAIDAFVSDPTYAPFRAARLAGTSGDMFAFATEG